MVVLGLVSRVAYGSEHCYGAEEDTNNLESLYSKKPTKSLDAWRSICAGKGRALFQLARGRAGEISTRIGREVAAAEAP